jgi:hypothetical protein
MTAREENKMRGWMILFALMAVAAAGMSLTDAPIVASAKGASIVFGTLFLLSLAAQAMRGRAE